MKRAIAALSTLAILGFAPLADASVYVGWSAKGQPKFTFKPSTPAVVGSTQEITISNWYKNIQTGTLDACGYKTVSAGASAAGVTSLLLGGTRTETSTLPVFDGSCNSTTAALVPKVEGAAVPTSHYMTPDGKLRVKAGTATFFQVTLLNQKRTLKADKCGNFNLSIPAEKDGQPNLFWDATTVVNGTTYNLEDAAQDPIMAPEGICSGRWTLTGGLLPEKIYKFFVQTP